MQLRSGRSTLRRDSRNMDEFNERRKYQEEQRRIEDSIYEDEPNEGSDDIHVGDDDIVTNEIIIKKMKYIRNRTRHLLYLNEFQKKNNHSFTEKVKTIMEIYQLFRYNTEFVVEYYTNITQNKKFPEMIYQKGIHLCIEMLNTKRTRQEHKLYLKCKEDIHWVLYLLNRHVLHH
jgi:hypothetical protein